MTIRLSGTTRNRGGIGARVRLGAGGRSQTAEVRSGGSDLSHDDARVHFGLGAATRVDRIEIWWASGVRVLPCEQRHRVATAARKLRISATIRSRRPEFRPRCRRLQGRSLEGAQRCPSCHELLSSGLCPNCDAEAVRRLAQRQFLILLALVAACVWLFLFTRSAAARLRETKMQTAAVWFDRGQTALGRGDVESAVAALRAATTNNPESLSYSLALADALVAATRGDQARTLLLRVRETAPDHPQINTQLARLAVAGRDLPTAVRYYQNALYGVWGAGQEEEQRLLRIELIRLLLEQSDRENALSQIFVLSKNIPGEVEAYVQVGELFLDAGSPGDALETFDRALQLVPRDGPALAGAGRAAFDLEDYARAERHLRAAVDQQTGAPDLAVRLEVVRLMRATDPMAPRLSAGERQRRLGLMLERAVERLEDCGRSGPVPAPLLAEATGLRDSLQPGSVRRDPNLPEVGVELAGRVEEFAAAACGPGTPLDEALQLIARRHADTQS